MPLVCSRHREPAVDALGVINHDRRAGPRGAMIAHDQRDRHAEAVWMQIDAINQIAMQGREGP